MPPKAAPKKNAAPKGKKGNNDGNTPAGQDGTRQGKDRTAKTTKHRNTGNLCHPHMKELCAIARPLWWLLTPWKKKKRKKGSQRD